MPTRDINKIFTVQNVADLLSKEELSEISRNAINGYDIDEESRSEWKERNEKGMKLAMQIAGQKNFPFENAANIMYPLIAISAIQFSSRAYPNLIPGWDIIKSRIVGMDELGLKAAKAQRVSTHMNYQLNEEMTEWEDETDRLLVVTPIIGCAFKETFWSVNEMRNMSLFHSPEDIVMHYKAKSMATVPRITRKYTLYPNEIIERKRAKIFLDFEFTQAQETKDEEGDSPNDEFKPHLFLQQHTWLDLDNDGYREPYILNIHKDSEQTVRIIPRFKPTDILRNTNNQIRKINAKQHYTKFTFLPSPDGSIYDLGFGSLLGPINRTVNTTTNQLVDAGTLNNCQGGFLGNNISLGRGGSAGPLQMKINEWMPVKFSGDDLKKHIVPLNQFLNEPSGVLFNLLGFMVQAGEKLSSVSELMMGDQSVQNEPATTSLARIEQGLKVFSSIHKRLYRSFKQEYNLLFDLNAEKLNPSAYYTILDNPKIPPEAMQAIMQEDYDRGSCDIIPVASPDEVSNTEQLQKAQILYGMQGQGFNDQEIRKRFIHALRIPDPEAILSGPEPQPDPKLVIEGEKLDLERDKLEFEMMKFSYDVAKIQSEIIKNLAEAESKEIGPQLEEYKMQMQALIALTTKQGKQNEGNNQK